MNMTTNQHTPDEFNAFYAAAVCERANDALAQWLAGADTIARTALDARRDYIIVIRDLHLEGLDGALVPVSEYLTADVTNLYIRQAAVTKSRPRQYRVRLLNGEYFDVSPGLGGQIYVTALRKQYGHYTRMSDDKPGHAKWCNWKLGGNDLGLLLPKEELDDRYVVAG